MVEFTPTHMCSGLYLGRRGIGIEVSSEYCKLMKERLTI